MRRPDSNDPEPPGGRAAERLREFFRERLPQGEAPDPGQATGPDKSHPPRRAPARPVKRGRHKAR